nr:MAG TPA: hypothetical protein [Caudoviricetes sp.]
MAYSLVFRELLSFGKRPYFSATGQIKAKVLQI